MTSKPEIKGGDLMVGTSGAGDVVINLDRDRTGHLIFHPNQARDLANLLIRKAEEAEAEWEDMDSFDVCDSVDPPSVYCNRCGHLMGIDETDCPCDEDGR